MRKFLHFISSLLLVAPLIPLLPIFQSPVFAQTTTANFKVAFIGDSGAGPDFQAVLNLIKNEGAQMVLHQGDFDYSDGPTKWMQMIDTTLGSNFPYLGSDGNHDNWDSDGYANFFKSRLTKMGLTAPSGNLPPSFSATYNGLKMVFSQENGDPSFIDSQLTGDTHTWKICSWHKNMNTMQVGGKGNEQGWEDYETCKKYGAIIATAHEHTYHRTKTLTSAQNLVVDTTQHPLQNGVSGNQNSVLVAPGKSFVFVSGLGGASTRNQDRCLPSTYPYGGGTGCNYIWANIYTSDQGAKYGALFITFNYNGQSDKAHGYFKNISNQVVDEFDITAAAGGTIPTNPPNPTNTIVPNQPTSTPFLPSPTSNVSQPTTTPLPTAPSTNPCLQAPTLACFLTWVNEFIGNYLTKYSDFNQDNTINLIDYEIWRRGQNTLPTSPAFTPTPTGISVLSPTPTINPTLTATPTLSPSHTPTPVSPTPTTGILPTTTTFPQPSGIWVSADEIRSRPTSGAAWSAMYNIASGSLGTADISNQDSTHDTNTLAAALVCARTGQFCANAKAAVVSAINTENGGRWLAVGRNLTAYVIAADVLNLRADGNPSSDGSRVQAWLTSFLTKTLQHNNDASKQVTFPVFESGSNASAEQGAGYAAVASYLKNKQALDYAWNRFRLYSCDLTSPEKDINIAKGVAGGWAHSSTAPCAVNPIGTTKNGRRIDGAIINDMVRGGSYTWPPGSTQYPWVGLEGYVPAALILYRAGYPAFQVANQAVLRTHEYLWYLKNNTSTDWWGPSRAAEIKHLVNVAYGKSMPISYPVGGGRTVGYTDWTHPNGL